MYKKKAVEIVLFMVRLLTCCFQVASFPLLWDKNYQNNTILFPFLIDLKAILKLKKLESK